MARSRMMTDEDPASVGAASPRTTIVGGRPPEEGATLPPVPTGIQRLLRLGAVDAEFRRKLAERPIELARACGIELSASECALLGAIAPADLAAMAAQVPPPPAPRRELLRRTAATAVVLLGGAALAGTTSACRAPAGVSDGPSPTGATTEEPAPPRPTEPAPPTGIAPDMPPERPDHPSMQTEGGAAPDEPPERPVHREMDTDGGAAPDMPPERPTTSESASKGGARGDLP